MTTVAVGQATELDASLSLIFPVTAVIGIAAETDATINLAVDPALIVLTGNSGTFLIKVAGFTSHIEYTPAVDGSLVITPTAWSALFTVNDSDDQEVQVSPDPLSVIWSADELMQIFVAADEDEPNPDAIVSFDWSYAARAASSLSIAMDYDYIYETPGGLLINLSNGQPADIVRFTLIGPTAVADFQTVSLDEFGRLEEFIVNLPAALAGDYYLRIEGETSGSEDVPITIQNDSLDHGPATAPLDTPPVVDPAQHWRFYDLRDAAVNHAFPRNPKSWTNVFPPNDFTHDKTSAPNGQSLTWQGASRPWRMEFTGWLDTKEEYDALVFWSGLRRRFWLIDHRNRAWLITIEQFDAQAQVKPHNPWAHTYTVKTLVFMQGTTD